MDQINLGAWINRNDTVEGAISAQQAALIHAVVGADADDAPQQGDVLPQLWHWCAFPPKSAMSALGPDGHPKLTDFMPPIRLNRRMWAGGNIEFLAPLHVGEHLSRRTTIANISEKSGAGGDMVIMSLDHEIYGEQGLAVLERQDIVYLEIPDSYTPPRAIEPPVSPDVDHAVELSTPLLFRYSAITFNAHRIHYDLPYTRDVEHYPDLVVHGPLQAQMLMDLATRERGSAPRMFSYRGVHPLFAGDDLRVMAQKETACEWSLSAVAGGSHQTMKATAVWEV